MNILCYLTIICSVAMISESIGIEVSSRHISKHLPIAWKAKTVELQTPSISTANRFDGVSQQWRELLGRHSGEHVIRKSSLIALAITNCDVCSRSMDKV
jgi:hypothetical protein